jgi:hypothetical protein
MQIRKTYQTVNPELLYREIKDFAQKQGTTVDEDRLETFSSATDSSSFTSRGTLTFNIGSGSGKTEKQCIRVHIVGSVRGETKLMLDIDEKLFPQKKVTALEEDLDFFFGSYEVKPR